MLKNRFITTAIMTIAIATPTFAQTRNAADPKAAVEEFLHATQPGHNPAIPNALIVPPDARPSVDTFLQLIFASNKLQAAAQAKFGTSGTEYFGNAPENQLQARLKTLK